MKLKSRFLTLAILSLGITTFSGCNQTDTPTPEPEPEEPAYKKSERAMDNFKNKLNTLSYKLVAGDIRETSVVSDDIVILRDPLKLNKSDQFFMSCEGEAFSAYLPKQEDQPLTNLEFKEKGTARKASEVYLPNLWFDEEATGKTIWNLFVNSNPSQTPFHYAAKQSAFLPESLSLITGLEKNVSSTMKNITMDFDEEDVKIATIHLTYIDNSTAVSQETNLDITITFDISISDRRIENWISNPNKEYPASVGEAGNWKNTKYASSLQSVTNVHEDIDAVIPFIEFASYAVVDNTKANSNVYKIHDYNATEENLEAYKAKLITNEYTPVEVDKITHYRKLLRERDKKGAYVDIELMFNDGLSLVVSMFYDGDTYSSLEEFNKIIQAKGFDVLSDTEVLSEWDGLECTFRAYESSLCLLNYKLYATITAKYTEKNDVQAYLNEYISNLLEKGYEFNKQDNGWIKKDSFEEWVFGYSFGSNNTIEFKVNLQEYADPSEAETLIEAAGFPELGDGWDYVDEIKYLAPFVKFTLNLDCSLAYEVSYDFDNPSNCEKYKHDYIQAIKDDGFKASVPDEGMTYYSKDNLRIRVTDPGDQSTFFGLNFYVFED